MRSLLQHQKKALKYLDERSCSGELFMEMRLGKTLVAIRSIFRADSPDRRGSVLVVCPIEGIWAWKRELEMEGVPFVEVTGSRSNRLDALIRPEIFKIINYEGLRTVADELREENWNAIIVDESRRIANPKNVSTKILQSLPRTLGQVRLVLSGEPAPESPLEYFEQIRFVEGQFMGIKNYWQFRNAYFREFAPHDWQIKPRARDRFKHALHQTAFFQTRKEAGLKDRKIYEVRTVKLPSKVRRQYEEIKKEFQTKIKGQVVQTKWLPVQYMWLHQISSGWLGGEMLTEVKTKALENLLVGELRSQQVVVWFKFNAPLRHCLKRLDEKRISNCAVYGDEPRRAREHSINAFRGGRCRVLLAQIKCAKTAIDLSNSSTAIYFSNSHSLEERKQSEDRILNPLKKEPLLYLDLVAEDTVEEAILQILKSKKNASAFYWNKILINFLQGGKLNVR